MSSIARPPDPCLIAIILTVHSRARPHFVFHYPPNPLSENALRPSLKGRRGSRAKPGQGTKSTDSSSSSESSSSSDEDEEEGQSQHLEASGLSGRGIIDERERTSSLGGGTGGTGGAGGDSQRTGSLGSSRGSMKRRSANYEVDDDRGVSPSDGGQGAGDLADGEGNSPPWETLLGLPADVWEKLLSPSKAWHKRRFEIGINDLAFVGWPVFVRDDGTWRKQKRKKENSNKKKKPRADWEGGELGHNDSTEDIHAAEKDGGEGDDDDDGGGEASITSQQTTTSATEGGKRMSTSAAGNIDYTRNSDNSNNKDDNNNNTNARKNSKAGKSSTELPPPDDDKDSMTMFNVVFVVDPPLLEYSERICEIYDNIIKKFAKALKWEQARTDYVWTETQQILHIKERAKEKKGSVAQLYSELIAQSSLARAIYTVFSSVSSSKIASVSLNQHVSISLQIPPLTSTSYLPGPTDKAYPGLWLTTADSVSPSDDPAADPDTAPHQVLAKHFALLLLDSEATILKDIEMSGGALAPALAHYIRCSKPTKSFAQISASSGIPLPTIQMLASHLVYWRRARAIPPIRQHDTYIVSPNCDLSKLEVATAAYGAAFPTLPSLPKMLSALSGTPRPYGSFIPSKDHKETYFSVLAWLLRGGWVTQLRAFGRVKVSPEIKMAVEIALRKEEVEKYLAKGRQDSSLDAHDDDGDGNHGNEEVKGHGDFSSSSSSSLASQVSGDETQDPDLQGHIHGNNPIPSMRPELGPHPTHSLLDKNTLLNVSSLIQYPHRASPLESRWLDEIMSRFPDPPRSFNHPSTTTHGHGHGHGSGPDAEYTGLQSSLKTYWPAFTKYFNGSDALEKITVREGLKRKVVWQVLARLGMNMGQAGSNELNPREQVLVGVRHW